MFHFQSRPRLGNNIFRFYKKLISPMHLIELIFNSLLISRFTTWYQAITLSSVVEYRKCCVILYRKEQLKQECIPVGCVPTAAVLGGV